MIIVKATMYPGGGVRQSYEVLHASVTNIGQDENGDKYSAHVTQRPWTAGPGFEADVEVRAHRYEHGFAPLFCAILGQAAQTEFGELEAQRYGKLYLPSTRTRGRCSLHFVDEFNRATRRYL